MDWLRMIKAERERQDKKWGEQNHNDNTLASEYIAEIAELKDVRDLMAVEIDEWETSFGVIPGRVIIEASERIKKVIDDFTQKVRELRKEKADVEKGDS